MPRARGLRLLGRLHGYDRMAGAVADLERSIADAKFEDVRDGEAPPWLRWVRAVKGADKFAGDFVPALPASAAGGLSAGMSESSTSVDSGGTPAIRSCAFREA